MTTVDAPKIERASEQPRPAAVEADEPPQDDRPSHWLIAGVASTILAGIVLRFFVRSRLWLDEALSVNIARLPLMSIPDALRHDGAPPLYYFLLHGWMLLFGTGDVAVRALSGVFSVAALPLMYAAGRRIGGSRVAWAAVLLAATSPFATHYATETRMYSLVALLAVAGYLALVRAVERPTLPRLAVVAAMTALLLYTHYWAMYLVVIVGGWMLVRAWFTPDRGYARRSLAAAGAVASGAIAFVPWLPILAIQAAHTGTPWARPADFGALVAVIHEFAGGGNEWAQILALVLFALVLLGVFGRAIDHHRVELDLHTMPRARGLLAIVIGTPALAIAAGFLNHSAFMARYTSVVFPAFCLLVASGAVAFADRRVAAAVIGVASVLGLWCSFGGAMWAPRTQAAELAATIHANAHAGDVLAFCPDQLGPSVDRVLSQHAGPALHETTYPRGTAPQIVDWSDYGKVIKATSVGGFAQGLVTKAGLGHDVWLVAGKGYNPFHGRCNELITDLTALRPNATVVQRARTLHYYEHATLYRFDG